MTHGRTVNGYPGPPMTLGNAPAARVRLIVWCEACQHQVEPEPAEQITSAMFTEMAVRYGAENAPFSIGASGWSVPAAAAGRSIWWRE